MNPRADRGDAARSTLSGRVTTDLGGRRPPVGLYVHVPFCLSLCPYCDFVVYPGGAARGPAARVGAFVEALLVEIGLRADALDAAWGRPGTESRPGLASVYLGGGTPSLLDAKAIGRVLDLVRDRLGLVHGAEVTLEANPGPAERGDARAFAAAGVNRLSIGAQALDVATLRGLGRRHAPDDVTDAVAAARAAGIRSISIDLLYDLPGQTLDGWSRTLDAALALGPDHLSLYALTLDDPDGEGLTGPGGDHLPVRPGARRWREQARSGQDEDRAAAMYELALGRLARGGFRGYEISNWARSGHESRHNLAYWRRLPVEAVGPGAHAFDGGTRRWNAARLDGYLDALTPPDPTRAPALPPGGAEWVSVEAARAEWAILGLRLDDGLPAEAALTSPLAGSIDWALERALVALTESRRIVLTTRGRLLSNELFARLV